MVELFKKQWKCDFYHMAESAGIPFTGKTGWNAVTSYCPPGGNIVVLFSTHVGIDRSETIGQYENKPCC